LLACVRFFDVVLWTAYAEFGGGLYRAAWR